MKQQAATGHMKNNDCDYGFQHWRHFSPEIIIRSTKAHIHTENLHNHMQIERIFLNTNLKRQQTDVHIDDKIYAFKYRLDELMRAMDYTFEIMAS